MQFSYSIYINQVMGSYYFTLLCVCIFPFIALALLIGSQEGYLATKSSTDYLSLQLLFLEQLEEENQGATSEHRFTWKMAMSVCVLLMLFGQVEGHLTTYITTSNSLQQLLR